MALGNAALVKWVNEFLELETPMKKVDELSNAICYAQLLDALFPGKVPVSKINFSAKNEYDLINNWKVIQGVFTAQGISKPIDVAKLVKGKTQDNLEFCQWFKSYFDSHHDGSPYPAREKRAALGKKPASAPKATGTEKKGLKQPTATPAPKAPAPAPPANNTPKVSKPVAIAKPIKPVSNNNTNLSSTPQSTPAKPKPSTPAPAPVKKAVPSTPIQSAPVHNEPEPEPQQEQEQQQEQPQNEEKNGVSVEEYNNTLTLLRETIEGLEKERNYYFKRLQAVEVYCQKDQTENPIAKRDVLAILYAEDDAKDTKDESSTRRSSQEVQQAPSTQQQQQQPQSQVQSQNELSLADDGLLDAGAADGDLTSY